MLTTPPLSLDKIINTYLNDPHEEKTLEQKLEKLCLFMVNAEQKENIPSKQFIQIQHLLASGALSASVIQRTIIATVIANKDKIPKAKEYFHSKYRLPQIIKWSTDKTQDNIYTDLSFVNLNKLSPVQWRTFLFGLQYNRIIELDLSGNDLYEFSKQQWHDFFTFLKQSPTITKVNLSRNNLNYLPLELWEEFFVALSRSNVSSLILDINNLHQLARGHERWDKLMDLLSNTGITFCSVNGNELKLRHMKQLGDTLRLNFNKSIAFCSSHYFVSRPDEVSLYTPTEEAALQLYAK